MTSRGFFFGTILVCGLSYRFMDLASVSALTGTFLPFLFAVTLIVALVMVVGRLLWRGTQWRRDNFGGGHPGRSTYADGSYGDPSTFSLGSLDSSCGNDSGACDCGGGGDGGGGGGD